MITNYAVLRVSPDTLASPTSFLSRRLSCVVLYGFICITARDRVHELWRRKLGLIEEHRTGKKF